MAYLTKGLRIDPKLEVLHPRYRTGIAGRSLALESRAGQGLGPRCLMRCRGVLKCEVYIFKIEHE